jgi:hypothetical protein
LSLVITIGLQKKFRSIKQSLSSHITGIDLKKKRLEEENNIACRRVIYARGKSHFFTLLGNSIFQMSSLKYFVTFMIVAILDRSLGEEAVKSDPSNRVEKSDLDTEASGNAILNVTSCFHETNTSNGVY